MWRENCPAFDYTPAFGAVKSRLHVLTGALFQVTAKQRLGNARPDITITGSTRSRAQVQQGEYYVSQ